MLDIPCVIFAGGKSSRMGEDKSLLPFGGFNTLTEFQLFRLNKIFKNVYISCKDKSKFNFQADFIEDIKTSSTYAPTAGFVAIFEHLTCDRFFALSVDTPFLGKNEIGQLINADKSDNDATIAKTASGMQPMCGIYHRSISEKFNQMLKEENHKLGYLLKNSKTIFVDFKDEKPFLNLNHPHEYQEALAHLSTI
ncbi:MAG: molybdenum cofactor guanylyltransferase MobA [Sulfurimonas sp.]|jgi:molybdopterin-guanine dinucleotide biosynthesis protein A|uniref:molybdenum cofactor guanylyltransferase MobA n=1 Tax=Sulfurimonas sp. TaxID=2022749 RepID=UPI001BC2E6AD|nr:molybdenum cofactor guanylyltransferase MobA [Sulfurimonas sp.]MDO8261300.1 molybdenum cofactor guanylyltransferase MobA [Candidatus Magasanikbacteria bacterium]